MAGYPTELTDQEKAALAGANKSLAIMVDKLVAERDAAQAKLADAVEVMEDIEKAVIGTWIAKTIRAFLDTLEDKPADGGDK